jgi:hypothetical protein
MVYIDDIAVFSHDFDSHVQRLEQVLQRSTYGWAQIEV